MARCSAAERIPVSRIDRISPRPHTFTPPTPRSMTFFQNRIEDLALFQNFGALSAFCFVNLAVIGYFCVKQRERRVGSYLLLPLCDFSITVVLLSAMRSSTDRFRDDRRAAVPRDGHGARSDEESFLGTRGNSSLALLRIPPSRPLDPQGPTFRGALQVQVTWLAEVVRGDG
jgi:hypothetical protein